MGWAPCRSVCGTRWVAACLTEGFCSPEQSRLAELESQAKTAKKGVWSEGSASHTIRDLKYTLENPRHFVDSMHQRPVNGEWPWGSGRGEAVFGLWLGTGLSLRPGWGWGWGRGQALSSSVLFHSNH